MTGILAFLTLFGQIFLSAGGPEKLKQWTAEKTPELLKIRAGLKEPRAPYFEEKK